MTNHSSFYYHFARRRERTGTLRRGDQPQLRFAPGRQEKTHVCAALGRAQLRKLDRVNAWRNRNYRVLVDRLKDVAALIPPGRSLNTSSGNTTRQLPQPARAIFSAWTRTAAMRQAR